MSYKEKILIQLRKGYTIDAISPKDELNSVYDKVFKPIINRKDLSFLIELFDTNEPIFRAWSFLGISQILQEKSLEPDNLKSSIQKIIKDLLNDNREISYFGGSCEIQTSLRDHHIRRISDLDHSIVFEPAFEYCNSFEGVTDSVVGELLENVISHSNDPSVEPLLLKRTKNIPDHDFSIRINIVNAYENLGNKQVLKDKEGIIEIFKNFLKNIKDDKLESTERDEAKRALIANQKKKLQENIFKVAAVIDLNLEKETLDFFNSLKYPFPGLKFIAIKYKTNKKFKEILLQKLKTTNNPNLIRELLVSILMLRNEIKNWKELILDNLERYSLVDSNLIDEMQNAGLLSEKMMINYFSEGNEWNLNFIREFLNNNPNKFDEWLDFKKEFIKILDSFNNDEKLSFKKEFALKVLLDLERKDLIDSCLINFKNLKNENLKKLCLFAIINHGNEQHWINLKKFLNENDEERVFFKKFWRHIKTREWKYYY
ncbi:MAG: hypothetical protein ACFFBP_06555 [Promethearchaeota archaeon]